MARILTVDIGEISVMFGGIGYAEALLPEFRATVRSVWDARVETADARRRATGTVDSGQLVTQAAGRMKFRLEQFEGPPEGDGEATAYRNGMIVVRLSGTGSMTINPVESWTQSEPGVFSIEDGPGYVLTVRTRHPDEWSHWLRVQYPAAERLAESLQELAGSGSG